MSSGDGVAGSVSGAATATITVRPVNDPPLARDDAVTTAVNQLVRIADVTDELLLLVNDTVTPDDPDEVDEDLAVLEEDELTNYAIEKHAQRLSQIRNRDEAIPDVEQLTALES